MIRLPGGDQCPSGRKQGLSALYFLEYAVLWGCNSYRITFDPDYGSLGTHTA